MNSVDLDVKSLEGLDFSLMCEYTEMHDRHGVEVGKAVADLELACKKCGTVEGSLFIDQFCVNEIMRIKDMYFSCSNCKHRDTLLYFATIRPLTPGVA